MEAVLLVLFGFAIGFFAARARPVESLQTPGEAAVSHALSERFQPPHYHLLNHVTLRMEDGTTQIDHILVSRFGIFVIETKDYRGWIYGGEHDRQWTQVFFRARFRFQNPLRQNYRHVCAVRALLDFLPGDAIRSAVIFVGSAEFRTAKPAAVFTLPEFLAHVDGLRTEIISLNRVQFCVGRLETARLAISRATDVEHAQELRRRFGTDE